MSMPPSCHLAVSNVCDLLGRRGYLSSLMGMLYYIWEVLAEV